MIMRQTNAKRMKKKSTTLYKRCTSSYSVSLSIISKMSKMVTAGKIAMKENRCTQYNATHMEIHKWIICQKKSMDCMASFLSVFLSFIRFCCCCCCCCRLFFHSYCCCHKEKTGSRISFHIQRSTLVCARICRDNWLLLAHWIEPPNTTRTLEFYLLQMNIIRSPDITTIKIQQQ